MRKHSLPCIAFCLAAAQAQTVDTVKVVSERSERTSRLPGEFLPYQEVDLHARVPGFVEDVLVDRGSAVSKGDLLVRLSAPEMTAKVAEARSRVDALDAQRAEAAAKVLAEESTWQRLKKAAETPGAVAGNELVLAEKQVEAAKAAAESAAMSVKAAQASVEALRKLESYLEVRAPFEGVITARHVHPGALAGPASGGAAASLLKLEQLSRLRLVVAVPETDAAGIVPRARVAFTVPAYPGQAFHGTVARIGRSLDVKTRTMPVELDVENTGGRLAPGMYAEVRWPVRAARSALLVPPSAVASNSERSFVIRVRTGKAEWVDVRKGVKTGDLIEVFGPLAAGDELVLRASDEIREGTPLNARLVAGK
jgi:RND family efflux transporter MFP subunit